MKKRWQKYLITFVLAAYFVLAGTGWNLVRFCCPECERAGIEQVAAHSCDAIHHHSVLGALPLDDDNDFACSDLQHHAEGCCHLLRLVLDNTVLQQKQHVPPVAEYVAVFYALVPELCCDCFAFSALAAPVSGFQSFLSFHYQGGNLLPRICIWII